MATEYIKSPIDNHQYPIAIYHKRKKKDKTRSPSELTGGSTHSDTTFWNLASRTGVMDSAL